MRIEQMVPGVYLADKNITQKTFHLARYSEQINKDALLINSGAGEKI